MRDAFAIVTRYNISELASSVYSKALSPPTDILQAEYKRSGIFPLSSRKVAMESLLPSTVYISPDKARKGVIYPLKTGIYALVGISERTFTR